MIKSSGPSFSGSHLTVQSPAKLILSGEHAVLYGAPAIAMAVNRFVKISISKHFSPKINFNFLNLDYAKSLTRQALTVLRDRLEEQYHDFLQGRCGIRDVLKKPFELLQFTVSNLVNQRNIPFSGGFEIKTQSEIPIGCGMGSSAATVISTLYALTHFFNLDLDCGGLLNLGKEAENLQHGRSSGLDLQLVLQGGCLKFQNGCTEARPLPQLPMTLIQTGKPLASTGECVMHSAEYFKKNSAIKDDFQAVTEKLDEINFQALESSSREFQIQKISDQAFHNIQDCIRFNHRLLVKIGVVPEKVQAFVRDLEAEGGSAKICGAGAIRGENAGVLLLISKEDHSMLAKRYGYVTETLTGEALGTRLV